MAKKASKKITDSYLLLLSELRNNNRHQEFQQKRMAIIETRQSEPECAAFLGEDGKTVTMIHKSKVTGKIIYETFSYNPQKNKAE